MLDATNRIAYEIDKETGEQHELRMIILEGQALAHDLELILGEEMPVNGYWVPTSDATMASAFSKWLELGVRLKKIRDFAEDFLLDKDLREQKYADEWTHN